MYCSLSQLKIIKHHFIYEKIYENLLFMSILLFIFMSIYGKKTQLGTVVSNIWEHQEGLL